PLGGGRAENVVEVRPLPTTVLESAFGVLVGSTRCLHHAVERQELDHTEHPHVSTLSFRSPAPCRLPSSIRTASAEIDVGRLVSRGAAASSVPGRGRAAPPE